MKTEPRFPTYPGELPAVLSPFNLHHYFLLAYWVFFRLTALKCYLYQADADLYRTKSDSWQQLLAHLRQSTAYRAPLLMIPVLILLISLFFSGSVNVILQASGFDIDVIRWLRDVAFGVALGVAGGVAGGVAFGVAGGVAFGAAVFIGVLRLWLYPFYSLGLISKKFKHSPLVFDEFIIFSLPRTREYLSDALNKDFDVGVILLAELSANALQRHQCHQIFSAYLQRQQQPLQSLYSIFEHPQLDVYVFAPVETYHWKDIPDRRQMLLGELGRQRVDTQRPKDDWWGEYIAWLLTRHLRKYSKETLNQFARLLYALIEREPKTAKDTLNQDWAQAAYKNIRHYPGGEEVCASYETMRAFLNIQGLMALAGATPPSPPFAKGGSNEEVLRPTVLEALRRLGDVGGEVAVYRDATSRSRKLAALARANDTLEALKDYVEQEVNEAEAYILRSIIDHWQPMITEAGGEIGRIEQRGRVDNPYVAGNPVTGDLFVGRGDVMGYLTELWSNSGQCASVILYGHRRMGKTSILRNIGAQLADKMQVVYFNMQMQGKLGSTNELLYNLALECSDVLGGAEPEEARFLEHNPYTAFNRYLKEIEPQRGDKKLLIAIDEFELIEQGIDAGYLDAELQSHWRGLFQTTPWLVMAFAGLHTLREMSENYWQPLFGSVTPIRVSFLSPGAARLLITNPGEDFDLDYDADALAEIIRLSHGQPYLLQLLCHSLVARFNRRLVEEDKEPPRRFSLADVQAVLESAELFQQGNAYFTGVWQQADVAQQAILRELAKTGELPAIAQNAEALDALKRHDVVTEENGTLRYCVPLMRQWVRLLA